MAAEMKQWYSVKIGKGISRRYYAHSKWEAEMMAYKENGGDRKQYKAITRKKK